MAGIGFELKKLFSKKGVFAILRAYGYASIVCTGPMLLGFVLLIGIRLLAYAGGADDFTVECLNSMITYTIIASLTVSSIFSMVTTRFTADVLYQEDKELVMPSFHGSVALMLALGSVLYAVFLWNSGIPYLYQFFCLILFGELVVVWTQINYLTAVKDYANIIRTFFYALTMAFLVGYILVRAGLAIIPTLLFTITVAYGIMMVWYYLLLLSYFPKGKGSSLYFLRWLDKYPELAFLGLFMTVSLFAHLVIMWFSRSGEQIIGLFYGAPSYDIPALFAFLSILLTTVNFVTSVEVNFYPKYRNYLCLFNDGGSLTDILQAEKEMKVTLNKELEYTFTKQFFITLVFIVAGTISLPELGMIFSGDSMGIFRVLCVGYGFYAVGNCTMLISLYFADNYGALLDSIVFMVFTVVGTVLLKDGSSQFYGFGFMLGSMVFAFVALERLWRYLRKLNYHILSKQPIVAKERKTIVTGISLYFERKYHEKNKENESLAN